MAGRTIDIIVCGVHFGILVGVYLSNDLHMITVL